VGEYKYYDRHSQQWSDYACQQYDNTERCVKMDCHLPDTHFSMLGFFKEPNYDDWMEQLFKHEGDCVWTDDEYQFMQSNRGVWPNQCTDAGVYDENNNALYYDLKPGAYGNYDIGLYTDSSCLNEYTGSKYTVAQVLQANNRRRRELSGADADAPNGRQLDGSLYELDQELQLWNDAFDVYKQCQPCKAYSLTSIVAGMGYQANADGNRYANANNGNNRALEDDQFQCNDAAGYTDVNQVRTCNVGGLLGDSSCSVDPITHLKQSFLHFQHVRVSA